MGADAEHTAGDKRHRAFDDVSAALGIRQARIAAQTLQNADGYHAVSPECCATPMVPRQHPIARRTRPGSSSSRRRRTVSNNNAAETPWPSTAYRPAQPVYVDYGYVGPPTQHADFVKTQTERQLFETRTCVCPRSRPGRRNPALSRMGTGRSSCSNHASVGTDASVRGGGNEDRGTPPPPQAQDEAMESDERATGTDDGEELAAVHVAREEDGRTEMEMEGVDQARLLWTARAQLSPPAATQSTRVRACRPEPPPSLEGRARTPALYTEGADALLPLSFPLPSSPPSSSSRAESTPGPRAPAPVSDSLATAVAVVDSPTTPASVSTPPAELDDYTTIEDSDVQFEADAVLRREATASVEAPFNACAERIVRWADKVEQLRCGDESARAEDAVVVVECGIAYVERPVVEESDAIVEGEKHGIQEEE
ncbi:hypothetical protein HYPSUDRAFT_197742 [Hypholoma sublateritium FD-334 SS-4]|uniref:Uncharacterized protein n=1 Tax=Hypholoma sublateritium (strain FD-334 SS-4) TaxID=945553 RepID=A0A0D2PBL4_HYPSF|nr:hypothetical protein HYPSUDRAFT_197742 [Hypholoma sublateritium FD-334 SS-4]